MRATRSFALSAAVAVTLLAACEQPSPAEVRAKLHLPPPGFVPDAARGRALFDQTCARCHGVGARGTREGPPLVHSVYRPGHHPDTAFHLAVRNGVRQHHWHYGHMPPVEGLSPEDVGHIVAYVRHEQGRAGIR